ncbi:MAG: peptidylprolyl isomerase [Hyphomonas sp.]|nr:peptidylprolyl isomerase [Hyphomonas sp.]
MLENFRSIGVAIAATALLAGLTACDSEPSIVTESSTYEGETAAIVNGEPIYFSDVELEAVAQGQIEPGSEFTTSHPEYHQVLEQLIDQRLLAQEALARGLDQDPAARRRLESGRERLLGNILVESLVASEVTEDAIDLMYEEQVKLQQLDDEVRVRFILVESSEAANAIQAELADGRDFAEAALEHSRDTSTRLDGGDLGWVNPNELADPFPAIIGDTETGAFSSPFETSRGWNILKVDERRTKPPKTKAEMRPEIITFLTFTQISDILRELRNTADIQQRDPSELLEARESASEPSSADETSASETPEE